MQLRGPRKGIKPSALIPLLLSPPLSFLWKSRLCLSGRTKWIMTNAQRNTLASSQGEEDLVSHEDKHSQGGSNAGKSQHVVQVIRYKCEYHRPQAA